MTPARNRFGTIALALALAAGSAAAGCAVGPLLAARPGPVRHGAGSPGRRAHAPFDWPWSRAAFAPTPSAPSALDEVRRLACMGRWSDARALALRQVADHAAPLPRAEWLQVLAEVGAGGEAAAKVLGPGASEDAGLPGLVHAREATLARRWLEVGYYDAALPLLHRCIGRWTAARDAAPPLQPGAIPLWRNGPHDVSIAGEPVAHAMESIAPRCLEDLLFVQQQLGHDDEAARLLAWQEQLWKQGPDLADELSDHLRRGHEAWHDDATTSRLMRDLAFHELHKQRSGHAIALLEGALALLQRAAEHGDTGHGLPAELPRCRDAWLAVDEWQMLAEARSAAGRADAARGAWARAVAVADARLHPRHVARLSTRAGLARAADAAGDRQGCREAWRDYTALAVALRGPVHPDAVRGRAARCAGPRLPVSGLDSEPDPNDSRRRRVPMAQVTLRGNPCNLAGTMPKVGDTAPDFQLTGADMAPITKATLAGKKKVIVTVPSLDTPVCQVETRKFNEQAAALGDNVVVVIASADLPFAAKRFCTTEGLERVKSGSDLRDRDFGRRWGVAIADGPLQGVTARAVFVVDEHDKVTYSELVPEIAQEPDYEAALAALKG